MCGREQCPGTSMLSSMKMRLVCGSALLAFSMVLAGCRDFKEAPGDGDHLDAELHNSIARGDWNGIYANADPGYREAVTLEKSTALFSTIVRKLGPPISSKQTSWNLNANTSGTILRSECETKFGKNASGVESIVWRKTGGTYRLLGYHINSDELISR